MIEPPGYANAPAGDRGGCGELTKVRSRLHTATPKSIRFSHHEKESAVLGYVAANGFKGFPASLPAAFDFTSNYGIPWRAALHVNASGKEVTVFSINDRIRELRLDQEMGELFPGGWESWHVVADSTLEFNPAGTVQCLRDISAAAQERAAHEILAKAVDGQIDRHEVVEALKGIEELSQTESLTSILAERAFDIKNPPPPAEALFMMCDQMIASPGNLHVISAKSKHGKSGAITGAIAATFQRSGDTLGFQSANPRNHAVIHLDTEQSPADHHRCILTAILRAGDGKAPPWLRSYRLVDRPMRERFDLLEHEMRVANKAHGGIHSVFLDGVADFISDPNDPEEAFAAVERLHRLAVQYHCAIWCVLHINPSSENGKTRGHLGSQLERKAATNLALEKDEQGITTIYTTTSRHASISKQDGPRFKWDVEKDMHISCAAEAPTDKKTGQFTAKYQVEDVLKEMSAITPMKATEIQRQCEEELGISKKSFYRIWNQIKDRGQVKLMGEGWVTV